MHYQFDLSLTSYINNFQMFPINIINDIINQVETKEKFAEIYNLAKKDYEIHQYNIKPMNPKQAKKNYQSLKKRYETNQIDVLPTNWNEGEKKLFVWFIICFLHINKLSIEHISQDDLESLSIVFYGKQNVFLDFQLRNLPKIPKGQRQWISEQDELLKKVVSEIKEQQPEGKIFNNWSDVAKMIFFQSKKRYFKTAKSCRQRWYNHVDPTVKREQFTLEQDFKIINYILTRGKSWSKVVKFFNYERTQHKIKNRYNTILRKYQNKYEPSCQFDEQQAEEFVLRKIKKQYEKIMGNTSKSTQEKLSLSQSGNSYQKSLQDESIINISSESKKQINEPEISKIQQEKVKNQLNKQIDFSIIKEKVQSNENMIQRYENIQDESKVRHIEFKVTINEPIYRENVQKDENINQQANWMWNYYPLARYTNAIQRGVNYPFIPNLYRESYFSNFYYSRD